MASTPSIVSRIQAGKIEVEDLTNKQLDTAIQWAVHNDGNLLSRLDDEVEFRQSSF